MPASATSLAVTDAYRARTVAIRNQTAAGVNGSWSSIVDISDLDRSFDTWLIGAVSFTTRGQAAAAQLADAYLSAFTSSELSEHVPPVGLDVTIYAGVTQYGRPLAELFSPALATVKAAIGAGRPPDEAQSFGRNRAVRNAGFEVDSAGRSALDDVIDSSDRVRGWRRVTSGKPCGACLAQATGEVSPPSAPLFVHPNCSCTKEPVVEDVPDSVQRPTGRELFDSMTDDEQNRLFEGRGGEAKAELIRRGDVPLSALITHNDQVSRQTVTTETPLADLRKG